ncbi:MAG: NAD+ synthase [Actinomycetota bacterium]
MGVLRLALAQINATVGDIEGNKEKIAGNVSKAVEAGADVVIFPELCLTGYPPEDLLLKPHFLRRSQEALQELAESIGDIYAIVGFAEESATGGLPGNSAALLANGRIMNVYRKVHLPNYGVFDEMRYFKPGTEYPVVDVGGVTSGLSICQDIWEEKGPAFYQAAGGAKVIFNINASPYHIGKGKEREMMLRDRAAETGAFIVYVNLVGGQDELVFDGESLLVDPRGSVVTRGKQFEENLILADIDTDEGRAEAVSEPATPYGEAAEIYHALVLGLHDYVRKNGFKIVVLGLSGGIDSALAAAIAADALGPESVKTVYMQSRFSSDESREDAREVAGNLRLEFKEIGIDDIFERYLKALRPNFGNLPFNIAEENIQARIRGNMLMALANKFHWMVLATGNKSELAVGYSTLYGDMAGGFEVIKDVPKTMVYKLADYRNGLSRVIPHTVIDKAPTAELRPDQKDTDSLPPYEVLDPIINAYVEQDLSPDEIEAKGFDRETVNRVVGMIDRNEYKRRQAPPGIKITPKAFGKDRRLPITNLFLGQD